MLFPWATKSGEIAVNQASPRTNHESAARPLTPDPRPVRPVSLALPLHADALQSPGSLGMDAAHVRNFIVRWK